MAARKMGLAVAGVDMLPSNRGPLILEVNSSPGLEGIEGATKVDIAGKIFQFLEKHAGEEKNPKRQNQCIIGFLSIDLSV